MKRVAILQSNYIPWKGYFDIIAAVDEFVLYDQAQFTKNDWRNRNKIKTPQGEHWLTVPVGQNISRPIRDVELKSPKWQIKHWKTIEANYRRAPYFEEIAAIFEPFYLHVQHINLSTLNRMLIEAVCSYLKITTKISNSWDYQASGDKNQRLIELCKQTGAGEYVSGPAAQDYIDESLFEANGINVSWFNYSGYREYPQLWGEFIHGVTILDLLFNCGEDAASFMKFQEKTRHG